MTDSPPANLGLDTHPVWEMMTDTGRVGLQSNEPDAPGSAAPPRQYPSGSEMGLATEQSSNSISGEDFDYGDLFFPLEPDFWAAADAAGSGQSEAPVTDQSGAETPQVAVSRKRRSSFDDDGFFEDYNRVTKARRLEFVPQYIVKSSTSRQGNLQLKALEWLGSPAKGLFDDTYGAILSRWGVQREHTGTCVLVPEAWSSLDPTLLMRLFSPEKCPTIDFARLAYRYADHTSTFARALTWFQQWPRRGIDLDNFLGYGPFTPIDASHLCHHNHCIVHIAYEGSHVNQDRRQCIEQARSLRTNRMAVPANCDKHQPPCLLQVWRLPSASLVHG